MNIRERKGRSGRTEFIYDFRDQHGVRRRVLLDVHSMRDAERHARRIFDQVKAKSYQHGVVGATLADYITGEILASPRATEHHRWASKAVIRLIGTVPLAELTGTHAIRLEDRRRAEGASDSTIRKEIVFLRYIAKHLFKNDRISHEAFDRVRVHDLPSEPPPRRIYHDHDQREALLRHCEPWLAVIVEFAYLTGWDRAEILSLDWSAIPAKGAVIDCPRRKTGQPRRLPITPRLRELIEAGANGTRPLAGPVFRMPSGRGVTLQDTRAPLEGAYRKAGLDPSMFWKGFRHTFKTLALKAGVDPEIRKAVMGHAAGSVTEAYGDVSRLDAALRKAVLGIEAAFRGHDLDASGDEAPEAASH